MPKSLTETLSYSEMTCRHAGRIINAGDACWAFARVRHLALSAKVGDDIREYPTRESAKWSPISPAIRHAPISASTASSAPTSSLNGASGQGDDEAVRPRRGHGGRSPLQSEHPRIADLGEIAAAVRYAGREAVDRCDGRRIDGRQVRHDAVEAGIAIEARPRRQVPKPGETRENIRRRSLSTSSMNGPMLPRRSPVESQPRMTSQNAPIGAPSRHTSPRSLVEIVTRLSQPASRIAAVMFGPPWNQQRRTAKSAVVGPACKINPTAFRTFVDPIRCRTQRLPAELPRPRALCRSRPIRAPAPPSADRRAP